MFLKCVRDGWRQGQTAIYNRLLLLTIARCVIFKNLLSTSSASWLGLLNQGSLRATTLSLQASPHSGLLVTNWLNSRRYLPIFFYNTHLLPLRLSLIYTGASLIDSSVKGQYIKFVLSIFFIQHIHYIDIEHSREGNIDCHSRHAKFL